MTKSRKRRHESGSPQKDEGEDGLTNALPELKAFIETKTGEAVGEIKKTLDQKLAGIEESLNFAYETITVTSSKVSAVEKELKTIKYEWEQMKYRLAQLEQEREEGERISRQAVLIFSGQDLHLPEDDDQLKSVVTAVIDRLLEIEVRTGQIISVKRLQARHKLLVKFANSERGSLRDLVFRAKSRLRGHKIFINESLTPTRQEVFNALLQYRKQGLIATVLTRGGEVLFAPSRGERLIRVKTKEDVEHVLMQLTGSTPAAFSRPENPDAAPGTVVPGLTAAAVTGTGERTAAQQNAERETGKAQRRGGDVTRLEEVTRPSQLALPSIEQTRPDPRADRPAGVWTDGDRSRPSRVEDGCRC